MSANRVRELRESRGLSQSALAAAAGLSRQSIGAIEADRSVPGVDVALRLASVLGCPVESLFAPAPESLLFAEPAGAPRRGRVALAHLAGRWVAHSLGGVAAGAMADGLVERANDERAMVTPLRSLAEARENVVIMGCATALGLLAERLSARAGMGRFFWAPRSSARALEALGREQVHVAGVHFVGSRGEDANVEAIRGHARAKPVELVTLARWEQGLVTAPGNPKKLSKPGDLARRGVRLVTREPGSGARSLLERELEGAGLDPARVNRDAIVGSGHLEVAGAVAMGAADVGIATRDAAIAFGLHFMPLAEERFDLVVPLDLAADPRVQRLLDVLTGAPFRREISALGYDASPAGERVALPEVA